MEQLLVFFIGASGYGIIELVWRGYTHWTMLVTGGICFMAIYNVFGFLDKSPPVYKAVLGSVMITFAEFTAGMIVNVKFGLDVWDYSEMPFNLFGQICLPYTLLWFALCFPLVYLCKWLKTTRLFRENTV